MALRVDIGIFAHNEAAGIAAMVARLAAQDIFATPGVVARAVILANGCTDATVAQAQAALPPGGAIRVVDLPQGGKSRTWNRFVHDLSDPGTDILIFADADIEFEAPDTLTRLAQGLAARPGVQALTSRPVKDIVARPQGLTAQDRLIAAAGGTLDAGPPGICGQLYAMTARAARALHLPIGLPVEDGFLRAMILTDAMTGPEVFDRIERAPGVQHIYASERQVRGLIRHQTRIVIGSAINVAVFDHLRALPAGDRRAELARAARDDGWLGRVLAGCLPRWPHAYVPGHFLTKRLANLAARPRDLLRPRTLMVAVAGFGFDAIVYVWAQIRMARGAGVGYW